MRSRIFGLAVVMSMVSSVALSEPAPDLIRQADALEARWAEQYLKPSDSKEIERLDTQTQKLLPLVSNDGSFSDLDYGPMVTGRDGGRGWGEHLLRSVDLFTVWRTPGTQYHRDARVAEAGRLTIEHYLAAPFDRNDTWGFGHPYADLLENNRIGRICLFARSDPQTFKQVDVERWANHITARSLHPIFEPSDDPATQFTQPRPLWEGGANVLWAVRGDLVPYLVSSDQSLRIRAIDRYMAHVWNSQTVRSPRGELGQIERLTVDGMLGEHAAPAMGSYGEWYINAVVEYRDLIQGIERWQMPASLNAHWIDVLIDSVAYCYQGAIDPNLANPLIWLNARQGSNARLRAWLDAFSAASEHRRAEVDAIRAWEPGRSDWPFPERSIRYYHTTDFMTKKFARSTASIRAVSERTHGMETFSQREPKNRWAIESIMMPLGTVLIRRDTRAYQNVETGGVFTAMDFSRWPGQTTRQLTGEQLAAAWNRDRDGYAVRMVFGGTPFAGGVVDGQRGLMSWWQSRYVNVDRDRPGEHKVTDLSVNGRRATFLLDDAVVHLGNSFDLRHPESTLTNVEQRESDDEVTFFALRSSPEDARTVRRNQIIQDRDVAWVWHDGHGYIPPIDGVKTIRDVMQPGEPQKQVFSIWSDHGRDQPSLAFEWAVLPDVERSKMPQLFRERSWRVLANSPRVQAVEVPLNRWLGAAFHTAGQIDWAGRRIEVSRACLMIVIENREGGLIVFVSDPLGTDDEISIGIGAETQRIRFPGYPLRGDQVKLTFR